MPDGPTTPIKPNPEITTNSDDNLIPKVYPLIVAAGKGSRFGSSIAKQYTVIQNKTLIEYTIDTLASSQYIDHLFLVIAKSDTIAKTLNLTLTTSFVEGGAERWNSVQAGVQAIINAGANLNDLVLIHDAARPCIQKEHIDAVIKVAFNEQYGAILGVPVADTLKKVKSAKEIIDSNIYSSKKSNNLIEDPVQLIESTINRENLWQAQTPQVFRLGLLNQVLDKVKQQNMIITDEASAFEKLGYDIRIVKGNQQNLKLTYQEDLQLIEMILNSRKT